MSVGLFGWYSLERSARLGEAGLVGELGLESVVAFEVYPVVDEALPAEEVVDLEQMAHIASEHPPAGSESQVPAGVPLECLDHKIAVTAVQFLVPSFQSHFGPFLFMHSIQRKPLESRLAGNGSCDIANNLFLLFDNGLHFDFRVVFRDRVILSLDYEVLDWWRRAPDQLDFLHEPVGVFGLALLDRPGDTLRVLLVLGGGGSDLFDGVESETSLCLSQIDHKRTAPHRI